MYISLRINLLFIKEKKAILVRNYYLACLCEGLTKFNPSTLFLWKRFIFCRGWWVVDVWVDFPCWANTVGGAVNDKAEWFAGTGLDLCLPFSSCLLPSLDFCRCCLINCNYSKKTAYEMLWISFTAKGNEDWWSKDSIC